MTFAILAFIAKLLIQWIIMNTILTPRTWHRLPPVLKRIHHTLTHLLSKILPRNDPDDPNDPTSNGSH